jgi:hypothetical protein
MSYHTPAKFGQLTPGKNQAKAKTANSFLLSPMPRLGTTLPLLGEAATGT